MKNPRPQRKRDEGKRIICVIEGIVEKDEECRIIRKLHFVDTGIVATVSMRYSSAALCSDDFAVQIEVLTMHILPSFTITILNICKYHPLSMEQKLM